MNPHAQALGKLGGKAGTGKAKARTSEQARAAVNAGMRFRGNEFNAKRLQKTIDFLEKAK
jgi:hypothetical protein